MYLKEGRSLLLKVKKPSIPFILNTNPVSTPIKEPQSDQNQSQIEESQVLDALKQEPNISLALNYFKSIANSNSFKHTLLTYQCMIRKLAIEPEIDGIQYLLQQMKLDGISCGEDLFVTVIDCYHQKGLGEQALKMFYRVKEFGCEPTVRIYNRVLDALLSENRLSMIGPVYGNMKRDGLVPDLHTYNILLKALCMNDKIDSACMLLDEMASVGYSPDAMSYATIVSSMCKLGKFEEARELVMRFRSYVSVYNALISGYCAEYKLKEAFGVLEDMLVEGLEPDVRSYSMIISSLSSTGNIELSLAVFAKMFGCFMEGRVHEAFDLWNRMVREGIETNLVFFNTVIHGLCSNGKVSKALSVSYQMEESGWSPNVVSYSSLINGFAKVGDLIGASETWNRMMSNGCHPNVVAYTSMVDVLCRHNMFDRAHFLIEKMVLENCAPNTVTFNAFIKGLCSNGQVDWAIKALEEMRHYGCAPNIVTYNELLDGLFKANRLEDVFGLIREIEEKGFEWNLVTYNTILSGFCHAGKLEEALQLHGKMLAQGIKPDAITYNIIIFTYCRQGKVKTAVRLLDCVRASGDWQPDVVSYTSLIWGLCNWVGIEEAISYLNMMINEGICPNVATWHVFVQCLFNSLGHLGPIRVLDDILGNG
ncbi:hypothetical protein E1A91_A01G032800v1 [Gossypium mustelinum]|uniref:Pentacotripeptide-repeat region of PRORP domain-containing protein n=1 Tax=Gossypium mustelinum TaxID=34275 RepID=A0A5D3AAU3_GOSMU|nr:hypothetical protein E1A91_A01G032800v1 [Gossypium mustelinum]